MNCTSKFTYRNVAAEGKREREKDAQVYNIRSSLSRHLLFILLPYVNHQSLKIFGSPIGDLVEI